MAMAGQSKQETEMTFNRWDASAPKESMRNTGYLPRLISWLLIRIIERRIVRRMMIQVLAYNVCYYENTVHRYADRHA